MIFLSELEALDYDIVFCTETWREEREEHCLTPSGHHIYLSGGDGHRGVGICISPSFFKRMKHIHFHAYSSRVSCLHFEIVDTKFVAIVCYMPTSWDTDAAVEENYSLLDLFILNAERINAIPILGGDFNASIGAPKPGDDLTLIGACGNGARNRRGARMIHWIFEHGLQVLNRLDSTMTIEECWTCRRAMDGGLVQLDFLLASLRVRVVRAWVDQSLPVGVDHRCVHSFIRICGLRLAQIKRCTKLKHWQPDLDENGTPSGFHTTVATALTKLPAVSAEGLEQCLVVAGRNHGRHGSQHLRFVPSRLLADLRLRRRQTNDPQNQKQLSFQIRKLHRKELRDWKSNQLERLLKQSSKWKILRTMDNGTGRWLPQQPQRHFVHKSPPAHPYLGRRIGEASNPGPTNQAQRQRTLHALTQMGIVPQREDTFHSPREDAIGESTPPMVGPNWQAQGPPEEPDLPPPQAARSWLYVPLLLHAAGELHATAVSAWAQHPSFAAVWPQWVAHLRRAVALPHSRLRAATFIQAAAMNTSPVWPHQAFRDLAPQDLCDITGAVCRCRDPSGYIPAPFQEVLLQLYGGEALCLELDRHLHQASTQARGRAHVPEDPVPAEDLEPMECPDTQLASVAGAHNAGGRRRRRRAQRPTPRPVVRHAPQLPAVSLYTELRRRVLTLQAPPAPLRGALKTALRDGLERIRRDPASSEGWALFLLAPRMLLYRQQGENKIALEELHRRVAALAAGHHQQLLDEAAAAATCNSRHTSRKKARDEVQIRAERAAALAQPGELSAASSALTAPPLAPANAATVAALRDPDRRPPTCQVPLPEAIAAPPLHLNQAKLVANLRSARRGAAAGPSGTTTEHLRVLLDDEESAQLLYDAAQCLASGDIPQDILRGLRLGRMVALQKPDGGVRGLVMSDVFRRLVGRTLAQQFSGPFNTFCAPFQYALSARAGTEALARAVRIASEANGRTTVLSIDGVGAYDHISRSCMLQGLQSDPSLATLSPYVRQFYGEPSTYLFYDEAGAAHEIQQGEGGEQGDPLMPALYAVGQHRALLQVHSELQAGENLFAYLDDIYLTCPPERAGALFASITAALRDAANVQVHLGKTRAWNEAGEEPSSLLAILPAASRSVAWTGSWALPTHEQGVTVLGTPLGHRDFVAAALGRKQDDQALLFQRIPAVPHLQSAWLLLLLCALPRCNYLLRALPPATTATYAAAHDKEVLRCLTQLLGVSWGDNVALPRGQAQLPLHFGGLGLRAATASCAAAHWASWADSLPVIGSRHPHLLASILPALQGGASVWPSVTAANLATAALTHHGFRPPSWLALAEGARPPLISEQRIFGDFARGWQRAAMAPVDREALEMLFSEITPASRALLLSQAGPGGSTVLTTLPTRPEYYMGDDVFRVTLLRRLRWPLPPTARVCRCGGELDILGDHRAACATAGVLVRRAVPVERVVAQICREAGGRVATDVFLRELNLGLPITDARRLEVVANGLPSFHGAQVAVDVTLVCPIQRDGCPRPGADTEPGLALAQAEERKSRTYPEFGQQGRCKLVVLALEVGGRWSTATQTFLRALARGRALASPSHSRAALAHALQRRWGQMLTVAANTAFSSSLLELPATAVPSAGALPPPLAEVVADARWT